jgi:hypothetical protein
MRDLAGRSEQLTTITTALRAPRGGLVIVTGESGAGLTSLLSEAGRRARAEGLLPMPVSPAARESDPEVVRAWAERHRGRAVLLLDDVHRAAHPVVRLLRDLHRDTGAGLLVSHQPAAAPTPDPVDCLRYEPDVRVVPVGELDDDAVRDLLTRTAGGVVDTGAAASLRLATGGNPRALAALLAVTDLLAADPRSGVLGLDRQATTAIALSGPQRDRLAGALRSAWSALDLDHLDDLCVLAARTGHAADAAPARAFLRLLHGQVRQGLAELRAHPGPDAALARALLLALGAADGDEADRLLRTAAATGHHGWLTAARAFLLAAAGRIGEADRVLAAVAGDDRRTQIFTRAAAARIDLPSDPRRAISHLRRALIGADAVRAELPWLRPLLTGMLIDTLLLAGRVNEATETTARLHAERRGAGWDIAVALARLVEEARITGKARLAAGSRAPGAALR